MGANQGRNVVKESAIPGIFQALAAGAAIVGLGVAAWNAMRSPASSSPSALDASYQERTMRPFIMRSPALSSSPSPLQHHQKRTFKFKVDASVKPTREDPYGPKRAGSGGVLRNEKGDFLCEFYQHLGEEADITAAELTAIKGALEVFSEDIPRWDGQYDELIVANDNDSAVRLAKGVQDPNNDKMSRLLGEIKTLVSAHFIKIDREDNIEAHKLADKGWKHSGPRVVSYN